MTKNGTCLACIRLGITYMALEGGLLLDLGVVLIK